MSAQHSPNRLKERIIVGHQNGNGHTFVFLFEPDEESFRELIGVLCHYARTGFEGFTWDDAGFVEFAARREMQGN